MFFGISRGIEKIEEKKFQRKWQKFISVSTIYTKQKRISYFLCRHQFECIVWMLRSGRQRRRELMSSRLAQDVASTIGGHRERWHQVRQVSGGCGVAQHHENVELLESDAGFLKHLPLNFVAGSILKDGNRAEFLLMKVEKNCFFSRKEWDEIDSILVALSGVLLFCCALSSTCASA